MLDTAGPLVVAFEELGKGKPDSDCISAAIRQVYCSWVVQVPTLAKFAVQIF